MPPRRPKPEGPFKLSTLIKKVRRDETLTPDEREFYNACYRSYEPGRISIRTKPELAEAWRQKAERMGMTTSKWCAQRILEAERPESPEVQALREELARTRAERDLQRTQFSELALERAQDKERQREYEMRLDSLLADELRRRGVDS
jgi:hypothetical protein